MKLWYIYILQCSNNTLYTGITNDLDKRLATHNSGKGAKYTRAHLPVKLIYFEEFNDRSSASQREATIKKFSRQEKMALISKKC